MMLWPTPYIAMDVFSETNFRASWIVHQTFDSSLSRMPVMVLREHVGVLWCGLGLVPCECFGKSRAESDELDNIHMGL